MAARKTGLGKGLDGLFPSYIEKPAEKPAQKDKKSGKKEKASSKASPKTSGGAEIDYDSDKKETAGIVENEITQKESKPAEKSKQTGSKDTVNNQGIITVNINKIEPNRNQPRQVFDEDSLNELTESIRQYGVISPVIVADKGDYYEIIAGERRWRAARAAGMKGIPVIIRNYDDQKTLEISLIENIQREDLNAIEEALAYKRLLDEFSLTQDEVSVKVSKSRSAITNALRLLKLDSRVQDMVKEGKLSGGHARALLAISDPDRQFEMAMLVFDENLSVREVEKMIKALSKQPKERKKPAENTAMDIICREMEDRMKSVLGTKVSVVRKNEKRGKIEIEYYSSEELERIYDLLSSIS